MLPDILSSLSLTPTDFKEIRKCAVQFAYQQEVNKDTYLQKKVFEQFVKQIELDPNHKEAIFLLVSYLFENINDVDDKIEKHSRNWKLSRIAKVDLSILRVGIVELLTRQNTAVPVILAEATTLANEFGSSQSAAFVNGLLSSIAKEVR